MIELSNIEFEISRRNAKDGEATLNVNPIHIVSIDGVSYHAKDEFDRPEFKQPTENYISNALNLRNKK